MPRKRRGIRNRGWSNSNPPREYAINSDVTADEKEKRRKEILNARLRILKMRHEKLAREKKRVHFDQDGLYNDIAVLIHTLYMHCKTHNTDFSQFDVKGKTFEVLPDQRVQRYPFSASSNLKAGPSITYPTNCQLGVYLDYMYKNVLEGQEVVQQTDSKTYLTRRRENIGFMLSVVQAYFHSRDQPSSTVKPLLGNEEKKLWTQIVKKYLAAKCWAYLNALQIFGVDQQVYLCLSAIEINADWERLPPKTFMEMLEYQRTGQNCINCYFNAKKFYKYYKTYSQLTDTQVNPYDLVNDLAREGNLITSR